MSKRKHLPFQPFLIWSAIALGLLGGFGIGAHLVFVLGFGYPVRESFPALIQVHGHLQLLGWTGLFIIGISLYKLPRLTSAEPIKRSALFLIYIPIAGGLVLRSFAEILIFYTTFESSLRLAVAIGCVAESLGILCYFLTIFPRMLRYSAKPGAFAASALKPFLLVSLGGWVVVAVLNLKVGLHFISQTDPLVDPTWNNIVSQAYIYLVLLPSCFAFSINTFPIFLRLRSPGWPVRRVAFVYALGALLHLIGEAEAISFIELIGVLIRALAVLWVIVEIDLLRFRAPWFKKFRDAQDREHNPPRPHAGDFGQFGNFEWLIYAAYGWLVVAVLTEIAGAWSHLVAPTIVRHFYLLGFVTHLILGMAVRMVPGFLGRSSIAFPMLVRLSFVLITISVVGRTFPLLFGALSVQAFRVAYALSGVVGMIAILVLGINLVATVIQERRSLSALPGHDPAL